MFKFLRKYNKLMLAVFGVLLMITFLIPQAFDKFAQQSGASGAVIATLGDGEKFIGAELEQARREVLMLERIGFGLPGLGRVENPEHWYLLTREADRAGLVGTGESVPITPETLQNIVNQTSERDVALIRGTYAKYFGVIQLMNLYQTDGIYSDRRLKSAAERLMHQVSAQVVPIKAQADMVKLEPSEEQIAQQMSKYASVLPGEGDTSFGYKLPHRVKVEWLTVAADAVRKAIRESEAFTNVAQRLHWRRNPNKTFPPVDDTIAVPEVVRDDLLEKLTTEKLDEIAKFATDHLRLNRRGLQEQEGYVVLPADWEQRKLSLTQLAADIQGRFSIELPAYESSGDTWVAISDLNTLEGLGTASTDKYGPTPVRFTQLVESAREFDGPMSVTPIQKDIAGPPLKGPDGSIYIFRIIGADPAHEPKSVDEVREAVVADLKREAHYRQLEQSMTQLEAKAEQEGLLTVAMEHGAAVRNAQNIGLVNSMVRSNPTMIPQLLQYGIPLLSPTPLPDLGADKEAVEAIIDYALALPRTAVIDELPEEQRTFVVPVEKQLAVAVVRITGQNPLSRETFADFAQKGIIQQMVVSEEGSDDEVNPIEQAFSFDALVKRHNYVPTRPAQQPEDESEPPAEAAAKAGS